MKIVHLFPKLLSLYGEYGNVTLLEKYLKNAGCEVEVLKLEEPDQASAILDADIVYVGCGVEENLPVAAERLVKIGLKAAYEELEEEKRPLLLLTGNAMSLFGVSLTIDEKKVEVPSLFAWKSAVKTRERYLGDAMSDEANAFAARLLGFVNSGAVYEGVSAALCTLELGRTLGSDKKSAAQGYFAGKVIATELQGPFLAKNPEVLKRIVRRLSENADWTFDVADPILPAYENAKKELMGRI